MPRIAVTLVLALAAACADRTWDETTERILEVEIAARPDHPWAGRFGSWTLAPWCSEQLVLSPKGVFTFHESCCVQTGERDRGTVWSEGTWVHVDFDRPDLVDRVLRLVTWDRARFLVPEEKLAYFASFAERMRSGETPGNGVFACYEGGAHRYREDPLRGTPDVPAPWAERIAFGRVGVRCLSASEVPDGATEHDRLFEVELEGSTSAGLWEGQSLKATRTGEWARVVRCGTESSIAEVRLSRTNEERATELVGRVYSNVLSGDR